jgi:hypothetical protein
LKRYLRNNLKIFQFHKTGILKRPILQKKYRVDNKIQIITIFSTLQEIDIAIKETRTLAGNSSSRTRLVETRHEPRQRTRFHSHLRRQNSSRGQGEARTFPSLKMISNFNRRNNYDRSQFVERRWKLFWWRSSHTI